MFAASTCSMRAPPAGLIYPDMAILYKVVLTRIHRWADQIARRADKDGATVRRGPKRQRAQAGAPAGKAPAGGSKRQRQPHNMQTRGIMLPMVDDEEVYEEDMDEGSAEDGDDASASDLSLIHI